ncbi:MAG: HAD family hydrolase [Clostridia bacterium]|nr:HAD family hydrolase [Clostridia bacterium]
MKTLYISDLDGTLIGADATPSKFTLDTINRLSSEGMLISLATSRSLSDAKHILKDFRFKTPIITMNGTFITDISKSPRKTLHHLPLERKAALKTCEILEQKGCPPNVFFFSNEDLDVEYKCEVNEHQSYFNRLREKSYRSFRQVDIFNETDQIVFIAAVGDENAVKTAAEMIAPEFVFNCTCYEDVYRKGMWFIEVTSRFANKALAAKKLKELTSADRIVAFGDNHNDLPLFSVADLKIAVENATDEVKAAADLIIPANTCDGVAKYLLEEYEKSR